MSSIGWVIRLINRLLLNAPSQTDEKVCCRLHSLSGKTGRVRTQIIYVWDWSVRSDPIISWDVNYTVLSLHVKRHIIEEGKRCTTFYLCFPLEHILPSLSRPLLPVLEQYLMIIHSFRVMLHCQRWPCCIWLKVCLNMSYLFDLYLTWIVPLRFKMSFSGESWPLAGL